MLRIDPSVMPTMAKTPTLAMWELEQLRTLENVVRRGHLLSVEPRATDLRRRIRPRRQRRPGRPLCR